jgi:hypothetical protein
LVRLHFQLMKIMSARVVIALLYRPPFFHFAQARQASLSEFFHQLTIRLDSAILGAISCSSTASWSVMSDAPWTSVTPAPLVVNGDPISSRISSFHKIPLT